VVRRLLVQYLPGPLVAARASTSLRGNAVVPTVFYGQDRRAAGGNGVHRCGADGGVMTIANGTLPLLFLFIL
jgi:hypothetical protein